MTMQRTIVGPRAGAICIAVIAFLAVAIAPARSEPVKYDFVDALTIELEGAETTTGTWSDEERSMVDRYFAQLEKIAPRLTNKLNTGMSKLGPVHVLRANSQYWSVGYVRQVERGTPTYLILSDNFFKAYDQDADETGYDGGNYTFWFFVHESVHLAELRSAAVGEELVARNISHPIGWTIAMKIANANKIISERGLDPKKYAFSFDRNDIDIVHRIGVPTKYALRTPNEMLAEVITASVLAPNYKPAVDMKMIIEAFLRE